VSWIDKIQTELVITTGDGKQYRPNWLNANKAIEYNIATFEFKELAGTLVYRGTPRGTSYGIEIYFQGEDHLDIASDFETSAADPRAWQIFHPFYGGINVQPISLGFDNSVQNVTRITGGIIETLSAIGEKVTVSAPDKIVEDKAGCDATLVDDYNRNVPNPVTADKLTIGEKINNIYTNVSKPKQDNTDASDYFNAYNQANGYLNNAVYDTLQVMRQVQTLVNMPATINDTVQNRLKMLVLQMTLLNTGAINTLPVHDKRLYEFMGATVIGAMVLAAITNTTGAYGNRASVISVISTIVAQHNAYLAKLDLMQSPNGSGIFSFIPSPFGITLLSQLVSFGVNSLLSNANDSKQERIIILEENSNIILLANRFYGLKHDDSTIEYFKDTNNIGLNEILEIKKGRRIAYYI